MTNKHTALRLVETRSLARDEWLEVRKKGIGSSDAAAAIGLSPYKSQLELWMEKTGRSPGFQPTEQDDPTYWGTLLEPYVATTYTLRTGHKVRKVNAVLQHPTFSFMLANLDREVVGSTDVQILECKTAGEFGSRLWRDGVPEYVQLQVQHQLAVTGKQAADVAVLLCGQKLEIHRIDRDDEVISRLVLLEADFWEHVVQDIAPKVDGSESAGKALRGLYPGADTTVDFSENRELSRDFAELLTLREELEERKSRMELLRQSVQEAMGDASRAVFNGGEVTFKRSKDGTSMDNKRLAADHPDIVAAYTVTRPGSRRFVVMGDVAPKPRDSTC